ncbi:MAG: acetoacetyl-CoA reductase, partial [Gammaproteobacteria bacterium]|nr:acetoacetyl-CoA reductase [Gammaproteobacteria bacterium]
EVWAEMRDWLRDNLEKGHLTPHDVTTGSQIAMIVTGGDIDEGTELSENDLLALERKAFVTLGQTDQTRDRIQFMLEHGSPLRN